MDKSLYKTKPPGEKPEGGDIERGPHPPPPPPPCPQPSQVRQFKSITISGKVEIDDYHAIFSSLVMPLKDNKVEIELKIKGTSTVSNPITENSQQYKITRESAAQLDLYFEEEE